MTDKIFILFSAAVDYNQPERAFECWWKNKPSIKAVAKALEIDLLTADYDTRTRVISIQKGEERRLFGYIDYWIDEVEPKSEKG